MNFDLQFSSSSLAQKDFLKYAHRCRWVPSVHVLATNDSVILFFWGFPLPQIIAQLLSERLIPFVALDVRR